MSRDTYKYHFKQGGRIVYSGTDLNKREQEHKRHFGEDGHIKQVGSRTTREAGLKWEGEQTKLTRMSGILKTA